MRRPRPLPRAVVPGAIAATLLGALLAAPLAAQEGEEELVPVYPEAPEGRPPVLEVEGAEAETPAAMRAYTDRIVDTEVTFDMLPIPAGRFLLGSPEDEWGREPWEGPQTAVEVGAFWMGRCEVTWDEYHAFMLRADLVGRPEDPAALPDQDRWADAVSRPTPPYVPMDFEMGIEGYPAISMTQFAAKQYTKWLSMKTGRFYRLPTEAEWEYACRAGSTTTWSFGDDEAELGQYAWTFDNSKEAYQRVGLKLPNAWGLHDMHGNVAEWVLDGLDTRGYRWPATDPAEGGAERALVDPLAWPTERWSRVVRGGSWDDDPPATRSAARRGSRDVWQRRDPQLPKSIWYLTNARTVGFRVVRPFVEPTEEQRALYWEADLDATRKIQDRQRLGQR